MWRDSSCIDCADNYQTCIACDTSAGFYRQGTACKNQIMLVVNEGIDTATGTIVWCSTTNCLDCKANYQTCVSCDTVAGFYLQGAVCKHLLMLGVNEGINTGAGTVVACAASNCLNCKASYQTCVGCNTGTGFYLQGLACKNQGMLGPNEGIDTGASTIVPCAMSNCLDCKANYQICISCNTAGGFYLQGTVCKNQAMLGVNEGINPGLGTIVACTASNCVDCRANYQSCVNCNMASGYFLHGTVCKNIGMLGINEGINTAASTIVPCSSGFCLDCKASYQVCTLCNTANGYYLHGATCKNLAMLTVNEGINSGAGTISTCGVFQCLQCKANYQVCTQCNTAGGYTISGSTCTSSGSGGQSGPPANPLLNVQPCAASNCYILSELRFF